MPGKASNPNLTDSAYHVSLMIIGLLKLHNVTVLFIAYGISGSGFFVATPAI